MSNWGPGYTDDGGFYSAEDADSYPTSEGDEHKKEGAFCVWTWEEVHALLVKPLPPGSEDKSTADLFCFHYDVKEQGNVSPHQDPHKELTNQNVLIVRGSLEKTAEEFNLDPAQVSQLLAEAREKLFSERLKRPKPHRDDKILTAWNGLMISGFACAAQVLRDPAHLDRAVAAAHFIRTHLYRAERGVLVRNGYRDSSGELGIGSIEGFADDYAFLIQGLLDLFEASQDNQWLEWASNLQDKMTELFWDKENGGFFGVTSDDPNILLRMKEDQDGAEPSYNSVAAMNLLRLSSFLDKKYSPGVEDVLRSFSEMLSEHPVALPAMLQALVRHSQPTKQIIIAGEVDSPETKTLVDVINSFYLPHKILVVHTPGAGSFISSHLRVLDAIKKVDGKATAYVCENYTCTAPVNDPEKLRRIVNPKKSI